jgi:hypothetical protein
MEAHQQVAWDEESKTLTIDGLPVSLSVLNAIANPDNRLLWQFVKRDGRILAIPYDERVCIWLDKHPWEDQEQPASRELTP